MSGIVWFIAIEFVLALCILIAFYLVDWLGVPQPMNKYIKALVAIILGALMIIKLLNFAGAM